MTELNLRLNPQKHSAQQAEGKAKAQAAAERKASANESLEDAFNRVLQTKLTDKQRKQVELAKQACIDGKAGRLNDGKLTQKEAVQIGKQVEEKHLAELREKRMKETVETKPDNYHVITKDSDLPAMVERLREEVRLQQSDEWFQRTFRLFNETHIRKKLEENGVQIPEVMSFTEWDTETSGTDTMIDLSGGYSFWLPLLDEGYYVAYGHISGEVEEPFEQCSRSAALEAVRKFIEHPSQAKAFHNTPFDLAMFRNDGLNPQGFR